MSGIRVLVAGASIAGPALAHWLYRRGAVVTVVERAPELRPGGQAVDARGVTKEVIRRMGLDPAVRAACTQTIGAHTVDADGNVLETFRVDDDGGDGFIAEIEILRGDLSQVLYDDTRDHVEYIFGDRIAELSQDADGVDVVFDSGGRRRFELVIGCDGLHSALRTMVFGPHEQFVRHLGHVLAFFSVPNEFGLDRWLIEYQEAGRSAGLRPIQDATRAMAMFSFPADDAEVDYRDIEAQKRLLRERMDGLGWLTPRILAHLDDTPDFYLDQVAQVVMDRWSRGRVGLLGDAAYSSSPMSGQGTGLALVGAYVLAGELAGAEWNPELGFARYQARMHSFVEANHEIARLNARSRDVPGPDTEPLPDFTGAWFAELVERALNGVELPDYAGLPDSGVLTGSPAEPGVAQRAEQTDAVAGHAG
ncbi:FAD-dependent monooxygenase [Nocardia cyriacigeorgica]|jgi:2-polyprenyl-6-methoxyphenol hydroxylase-like FAD-dependent oxidoreductase|uniref:FAD-dependent monooxygenase n=1 Tax=Nocardia cyriacigeorgica TaxID=135487 RepID=UPI0009D9DF37|nr:FAD-dependent monooxygenase [Nocardia cyriacigeorgica]AVH24334.1 FAD-dependent oxidoreductase [Nocardia cyriacigeorgica]MBF6323716.1 FAD-dependent monooxygenase [Nocardia cyriacigeorgica]MBF6496327.1 FAD-dependent monooxygenase [Nocardia cyriacigeorgica]PPJ16061.1 FAD-dependent oxidoreductase [Nocardia cyriacigeorgica]TLF59105.1 FAD-dependent oxidoreductase [Nocardia cyriacigeorgica]